jgi:DNA-binding beta-propeller fold protein YncE
VDLNGQLVRSFGSVGRLPGAFASPIDVTLDRQGNVYVTDHHNDRVQKFTATGELLSAWGQRGNGPNEFASNHAVAVDPDFNVYVVDFGNTHYVQHYKPVPVSVESVTWSTVKTIFKLPGATK